ncbi:hypothetical protein BKA59DRAFT_452337 [Fusarium tricinctum]|uniref:Uncharacterized protein n=1 Tax=Fusarium tricinctum TaxID=61284 RepID=A0A8K0S0P7_9HYPO|nr:hypothetical protein BKA59DRAFT_452337 [Fusarium tricinctum]
MFVWATHAKQSDHPQQFPQVRVPPRPEPDRRDEEEHAIWWREYQQWGNVQCACGNGYFCRRHAIWIPGGDVTNGLAVPRERQHEGCPPSHYRPQNRGETTSDIPWPSDRGDRRQQGDYSGSPSARPSSSRLQSSTNNEAGPSSTVSSRHRRPRAERSGEQDQSQQQEDYSSSASGRRTSSRRQSGTSSQTGSSRHRRSRTDRPPTRYDASREEPEEDGEPAQYTRSSMPSAGALVGSNETYGTYEPKYNSSYDQQLSQYGGSPPPPYGSPVTSNTSRTRQSTYQQVDSYGQPYPYTQQPAVQQSSYGEEPDEEQYQGRPPYDRQTSPREPQTYVQRYSYEQLPPGQRSDERRPEYQQYSGRQEPYGQQSPFGQTSPYAQAPPYGQQVAYSEYPPYAPYYGSSSTAQVVSPTSYRTETDSQELSARMGNVRLEDDPYRQSNTDERYEYEEDQEAVAGEAQATSSRNRAHTRRSGRR